MPKNLIENELIVVPAKESSTQVDILTFEQNNNFKSLTPRTRQDGYQHAMSS